MSLSDFTLIPDDEFSPWFFDDHPLRPKLPAKARYKIYHDGGHYIATRIVHTSTPPPKNVNHEKTELDILFDSLYFNAISSDMKNAEMRAYIRDGILKLFPHVHNLDEYITRKIERKLHNLHSRKKRFRRKANLNPWNYFVTITYDDTKHDENTFRRKLRRCLSNLHTRREWRYMGVFERAPETGRLHFHGILYIPNGEMLGKLQEKNDYSTRLHRMQLTHENSFFAESFGRNDFEELNTMELRKGNTLKYLLKYIGKTNERIVYSRGIPTEVCKEIDADDIASEMQDFVTKYVLFDDVVDWEYDVMRRRRRKQIIMIDILCNPPRIA